MAFLTPAQLAKAQAEVEGYQNGPQPALNPANKNTQAAAGNSQGASSSAVPYYPTATPSAAFQSGLQGETPNVQLSTREMSAEEANNMVLLDSLLVGYLPGSVIPVVENSQDLVSSIAPTTLLVFTLPKTTLYQVTFYYGPADHTGAGTWSPTASWTDPSGNNLSLASPYLGPATAGDPNNLQSYSIPFFCKGGTQISVSGAYSGTPFPMNISIRTVAMPSVITPV